VHRRCRLDHGIRRRIGGGHLDREQKVVIKEAEKEGERGKLET
jgi:hypothetical protein